MSVILRNTGPTTLTKKWWEDGTQVDAGTVTIGIVDADGSTVVASGTATSKAGSGATTTYSYSLAIQEAVAVLDVTWTRSDTGAELFDRIEVRAGQLFSEVAAREFDNADGSTGALNDATVYPDAAIAAARDRTTELLELWTGRSWIPRYVRVEIPGSGTRNLWIPDGQPIDSNGGHVGGPGWRYGPWKLLSATVGGSAVSTGNVKIQQLSGRMVRTDDTWSKATTSDPFNVVVELEYGYPYLLDGVDRIALLLARDRLVKSEIPDSAINLTGEFGNISLVQPGGPRGNVSRLPEVNAWVLDHRMEAVCG